MRPWLPCLVTAIALLASTNPASADVIIWPPEPPRPIPHPRPVGPTRVEVESLHLDVEIHDGLATTTLREVIRKVTTSVVLDGQLEECDLTFSDLHKIQQAFLRLMVSMHHHRVEYPGFARCSKRFGAMGTPTRG